MNINTCNKCDISLSRKTIVSGNGNTNKNGLMFIGEAPGYYEDKYGVPFIGNSGILFNNLLKLIGLTRNNVYTTNIIKCRPPNNRSPLIREINNCLPYLKQELILYNPKIIVLLGNIALNVYFNKNNLKISDFRGYIIPINNKIIIATYHPAYVLYNKSNDNLIKSYTNDFINIGLMYKRYVNPFITFNF